MNARPSWLSDLDPSIAVIAEVKTRSPFGWTADRGPVEQLKALLDWDPLPSVISIHTDELWGGSMDWLRLAAGRCHEHNVPVLAKGFHPTTVHVSQCVAAGAQYVLTVGWWPGHAQCWHEVESNAELIESRADTIVWNARDPRTGTIRPYWPAADAQHLKPHVRFVQASLIRSPADVAPGVNAILIGQALWGG